MQNGLQVDSYTKILRVEQHQQLKNENEVHEALRNLRIHIVGNYKRREKHIDDAVQELEQPAYILCLAFVDHFEADMLDGAAVEEGKAMIFH